MLISRTKGDGRRVAAARAISAKRLGASSRCPQ